MAYLHAVADGNWTDAATWGLCSGTFFLDSQAASTNLTTSFVGPTSGQTPGAITVDGIAVKVATRSATPTGTFHVRLFNVTGAAAVAGTEVSINVADVPVNPVNATVQFNGCSVGWVFFKFAAPVTLLAATSYRVEARTSSTLQISLFRDATASNWSRLIRTTTTQAPAAGDSMFVGGEWTAAGTKTDRTVTMNENASTDYGGASTAVASLGISKGGTLQWGTGATQLRLSGLLQKWMAGRLLGTDIQGRLEFDCAAHGDFGLLAFSEGPGEIALHALPPAIHETWCRLTTTAVATDTTLAVDRATGWLNGDGIVVAPTQRVLAQGEARTLNADAGASSLSVSSAFSNTHFADPATARQAHVIRLNRPFTVDVTSTFHAFVFVSGDFEASWVRFRRIGSGVASKTGFLIVGDTPRLTLDFCGIDTSRGVWYDAGTVTFGARTVTMRGCTFWDMQGGVAHTTFNQGNNAAEILTLTLEDCVFLSPGTASNYALLSVGNLTTCVFRWTRVAIAGYVGGIVLGCAQGQSLLTDLNAYACNGASIAVVAVNSGRVTLIRPRLWRNLGTALGTGSTAQLEVVEGLLVGNVGAQMEIGSSVIRLIDTRLAAETGFTSNYSMEYGGPGYSRLLMQRCRLGADAPWIGPITSHLRTVGNATTYLPDVTWVNCHFGPATRWASTPPMGYVIREQRQDGVTNVHQTEFVGYGVIAREPSVFRTAAPSERLAPASALLPLRSGPKRVPVRAGQAVTASVYVRVDGAYDGPGPRLVLAANAAIGIVSDVVLATASAGPDLWEQLQGSTPGAAAEDGVAEFWVEAEGTTGFVYTDDWSALIS